MLFGCQGKSRQLTGQARLPLRHYLHALIAGIRQGLAHQTRQFLTLGCRGGAANSKNGMVVTDRWPCSGDVLRVAIAARAAA